MIRFPARLRGTCLEWAGTVVVFLLAAYYWLLFFNRSTNLLDEGSTAWQALRVLNGELIYRDFFTVVTPGSYYTVAAAFSLFGVDLMVLRWLTVVTGLAIFVTTAFLTRRLAPWPFAAAAALLTTVWGWFLVTPNYYSLEASLFSLLALTTFLQGTARWLVISGLATGLAAMTKQNVGAYTAVALFVSIWASRLFDDAGDWRGRLNRSGLFIAGICIPVIPTMLYLVAAGAGPYLYESWIYYPLTRYPQRFALPYPDLAPALQALPDLLRGRIDEPVVYEVWAGLVMCLPVVTYPIAVVVIGVLAYRYRRTHDREVQREGRGVLALTILSALTLLQAWPRADFAHALFGMAPTFALLAYLLSKVPDAFARTGAWRPVVQGVALMPVLLLLWNGYQRTSWEYQNYVAGLHIERGRGISTQYLEAQRIDIVTSYITEHTTPDEEIFVVPWASGFYFLADRRNATRTDFMLFEDPELYPCLLARLDERAPKYVIYGYTWDVDGKRFRDYAAPVDRYIRSRYAIEFTTDGYEIWRRLAGARPVTSAANSAACRPRRFRWSDFE